ncbi:MAG: transketolase [Candidatus Omnitrophica bacterium]|nr:transketolase [Candidatus Omnitrophota bacterium]
MTEKKSDVKALQEIALELRKNILQVINSAKSGHPGGSLSAVEILISLYGYKMNYKSTDPNWEDRDRLIISKGHASPAVYTVLSHFGYFPKEELSTFRKLGTRLQGHVHRKVPGVELNTGSLGHGLSVANGLALGARMRNKDFKIYCLMGDGEIQEGSVWEAAMTAAHFKLNNVCAIVDYNKVQENGLISDIMGLEPLAEKWKSFGWEVINVNGHDFNELIKALDQFVDTKEKPTVIIANTIKGKGVSFMENKCQWHGKAPNDEQLKEALSELR